MTAQTSNSFLYEEPLVPCSHFCKDPMITPSMSLANSMFLPKVTELVQIFGIYLAEFSKEMKSQHLSQNKLVSMIATVCNSCAPESALTISKQWSHKTFSTDCAIQLHHLCRSSDVQKWVKVEQLELQFFLWHLAQGIDWRTPLCTVYRYQATSFLRQVLEFRSKSRRNKSGYHLPHEDAKSR